MHKRRRSTGLRALLSCGLLLGLLATGTFAYWTDQGTITGGDFVSGSLDLTAGPSTGAEDLGGTGPNTWSYTVLAMAEMVPNESISKTIVVKNSGTTPLRYNGVPTATTNNLTSGTSGVLVEVYDQSTANAQSGSQANGNRAGTCSGVAPAVYAQYVSTTSTATIHSSPITLAAGATRTLCVRVWLNSAAPNTLMTKSAAISIALSAQQVAAP